LGRKPGQFQDGHATLLKIVGDVVHLEGFIEKAKRQEELESEQGGYGSFKTQPRSSHHHRPYPRIPWPQRGLDQNQKHMPWKTYQDHS
jgi:hypothetical protein